MAENITLSNVTTFQNDTTATNIVNNNNAIITTAFIDVLSRSGTSPNQMASTLDMNSNQIINLPPPSTINSPARLVDVVSGPILQIPNTGTSGHVVPFLDGNNTWSGTNTYSNTSTFNGSLIATGSVTLPSNSITSSNLRQGVARSVVGVTGNATANEADIQGTTRQVLAVNTSGNALLFAQPQGDQLLGTVTNDNATSGNVGEFVSSTIALGSPISLSNGTPANITSISLTAGDWDVQAMPYFLAGATTNVTNMIASISTTSATSNFVAPFWSQINWSASGIVLGANATSNPIVPIRFSLSTTTTIFLVAQSNFTVSTMSAFGTLSARRRR